MPPIDPTDSTIQAQISCTLLTKYSLAVSPTWLSTHLPTPRPGPNSTSIPPIPSLTQTALFRLLASDFTTSLLSSNTNLLFPRTITDSTIKEQILPTNVPVQLLAVEDVGSSKWSQIEAIERVERGEEVRGREIVRAVDVDGVDARGGEGATGGVVAVMKRGPHKYVLQDAGGTRVVAFELGERVEGMGVGDKRCVMGMKLVVKKGVKVRRGVMMLGKEDVNVLGGKVEVWDEAWKGGAKQRLMDAVAASEQ